MPALQDVNPVQGFLISKALPVDDFERWIDDYKYGAGDPDSWGILPTKTGVPPEYPVSTSQACSRCEADFLR